jgi:hypothetical protein
MNAMGEEGKKNTPIIKEEDMDQLPSGVTICWWDFFKRVEINPFNLNNCELSHISWS